MTQKRSFSTKKQISFQQSLKMSSLPTSVQTSLQHQSSSSFSTSKSSSLSFGLTSSVSTKKSKTTLKVKNNSIRKFATGNYPPHEVLGMPALSPTMEQGTIASWDRKIGDKVSPGDVICQVTTDKAIVAFESTEEGYIAQILVPSGDTIIPVGTPVAILVEEEADVAKFANYTVGSKKEEPAPASPKAEAPKAEKDISEQKSAASPEAITFKQPSNNGRAAASPLARVTANELGVDLSQVNGTGMFGAITQENVLAAKQTQKSIPQQQAAAPQQQAKQAVTPAATTQQIQADGEGDFVDEPLSNMRKVIAKRLTESKQTIPHYYITVEVEMDAINSLRSDFNKQLEKAAGKDEKPTKLSVNDFIIKASAAALKKVPAVNSSWQDTYIRRYNYADISVAVSTDAGLITPIIADADIKGLASISNEMKSLAGKARAGKLTPNEYQGGTFTISNLGMFGVDHFSAIINPPQAAILAIGGTSQKVVVNPKFDASNPASQQFKAVSVMKVTASFDHRVVDGAVGAQFLSSFKEYCESATKLLL
jgi:pyruvate dehydrogenase E2 component (dihydrolipoamide acetyltransferase)